MDWSVVEPMVGILVSSFPAIRSVVYLFSPNYGIRSTHQNSSLKSNLDHGHVQLRDFNPSGAGNTTKVMSKKMREDDDSEKNLIYEGRMMGGVTKTTDIEVTRS